ncbi:TVP38/TMEM64 family protein [Peribacillus asahii]|uniref:Alkaline phosphatase n=1 Tax=Peribacillus asahii TaxID=228899 RepID=A0A3T0KWF0_9BACI|nr:VTT domain-containing protein [Peribacillus asahii]AZV44659.1 alkaline phosphatase [Peribacillus asahii]USK84326.1 VTT domain-containing protein [Peribacillus asahii]
MDEKLAIVLSYIQSGSVFMPFVFIAFHVLRQLLFIPVIVVCISGGILFGPVLGTIYSIIGLTLSNLCFYFIIGKFPKTRDKLLLLKDKLFGNHKLNSSQIAILRLLPFIHYYLLSFCLMESNKGIKHYLYLSFLTNIPLAFVYTVFGHSIANFSSTSLIIMLVAITFLIYLVRERRNVVPWREFFRYKDKG